MTSRLRCEEPKALRRSQRRGAVSAERGAGHYNITPVCQVVSRPDSGLGRHTSDNRERLVSFASANGMCIANTFFHTSASIKHHGIPLAQDPSQALKTTCWSNSE